MNTKIGFVGVGAMGWPMAANLIKAGFTVQIADARPAQASKVAADTGARIAVSLPALGEPILKAMGISVTWAGGIGSGQAMKALNNLVSAGGFLIGIKALLVGKKFGLMVKDIGAGRDHTELAKFAAKTAGVNLE